MAEKTDPDEGSGTVMVVGVLAALAVLACSALAYIAILAAGNRAQNIADLSALAGADVSATAQWESVEEKACRAANEVAQENGAMLSSCHCESVDTIVTVRVSSGWGWNVFRSARAGVDGLKDKKSWWRVSPSCFGGGLCGGGRARRWRRPIWG